MKRDLAVISPGPDCSTVSWWQRDGAPEGPIPQVSHFEMRRVSDFSPRLPSSTKSDAWSKHIRRVLRRSDQLARFVGLEEGDKSAPVSALFRSIPLADGVVHHAYVPSPFGSDLVDVLVNKFAAVSAGSELDEIVVTTGLCLFSCGTAIAFSRDGARSPVNRRVAIRQPERLAISEQMSLYETESVARLARCVSGFASQVDLPVTVALDIPRLQYYCYLLTCMDRDEIEPKFVEQWFQEVDKRYQHVTVAFEKRLGAYLSDHESTTDVLITRTDPLNPVEVDLRNAVHNKGKASIPAMVEKLSATDRTWADVSRVVTLNSLDDLLNASYVVEVVRNALPGCFAVSVENPSEAKILRNVNAVLQRLDDRDNTPVAGIYPLERVVTSTTPHDLYYNDPGNEFVLPEGDVVDVESLVNLMCG